jgi:hypothetical protein
MVDRTLRQNPSVARIHAPITNCTFQFVNDFRFGRGERRSDAVLHKPWVEANNFPDASRTPDDIYGSHVGLLKLSSVKENEG